MMIEWLLQSLAAHPGLQNGQPVPSLLSEAEMAHFQGFHVLKRQQDWLLGRWTAKLLLQRMMGRAEGSPPALKQISILPGADGAPRASFAPPFGDLDGTYTVSISHSRGSSFCAAVELGEWPLGADIEWIEPRAPGFTADFFTVEEQAQVDGAPPEVRDTLVTAVWSAKEAALKAVRQGLRQDTRVVSCTFAGLPKAGLGEKATGGERLEPPGEWLPVRITWQRRAAEEGLPRLAGWWRVQDGYVLTLAAKERNEDG